MPGTEDILAIWNYGYSGRTPLNSAISSDAGTTWHHLKLVERSHHYGYNYASITFVKDKAYLVYNEYPLLPTLERFRVEPGYEDLKLTILPIAWFYR